MLLNASEIDTMVSSMKTVNAVLYLAHKHRSTLKWIFVCDPIGAVTAPVIGTGHGGSISDPIAAVVLDVLGAVLHRMLIKVSRPFLVDNECDLRGSSCV